jgi:glycerophosphoryl diester phosphodiesterase
MRWTPGGSILGWLTERPVAHRGLHDKGRGIIENTASAFQAAIEHGFAIELDVQRTADGQAVVFHDATLERLTCESGPVAARDAASLSQVRITGSSDTIQTLDEILELVAGQVPLVIEMKSLWDGCGPLEQAVARAIADYDGPLAVMSFDPDSVRAIAHYSPDTVRGFTCGIDGDVTDGEFLALARRRDAASLGNLVALEPDFIAHHVRSLPSVLSRYARLIGIPVLTWTVRTVDDRRQASHYADQMIFEGFVPGDPEEG